MKERSIYVKLALSFCIFSSFFIILLSVYWPVIQMPFLAASDYELISENIDFDKLDKKLLFTQGRGLEVFMHSILVNYVKFSEDAVSVRLAGLIGGTLFALIMFYILRGFRIKAVHAFLMVLCICTLPSIQVIFGWMILVLSILPAALSSLSALLLSNFAFKENPDSRLKFSWIIASIILLITALNINQPATMLYWSAGIIFLLGGKNVDFSQKENRSNVITYFSAGFAASIIYYVVFIKMIPVLMGIEIARAQLISIRHIPFKIKWFITKPLVNAMNLWNTEPTYLAASVVGIIIMAGLLFATKKISREKKNGSAVSILFYGLILIVLLLSYLPNLSVMEPFYPYRTLVSLSIAIALLFFFGLTGVVDLLQLKFNFPDRTRNMIITALLAMVTVISALDANKAVSKFAILHLSEQAYVKKAIIDYGVSNLQETQSIYVRRPPLTESLYPFNEFEQPLTTYSECGRVTDLVQLALTETGIKHNVEIRHGAADAPMPENNNILIIDMTKFQNTNTAPSGTK